MWFEIPSMVLTALLSFAGVGMPQLSVDAANMTPAVMSCAAQPADTCLSNDVCDLFIGSSGEETCNVACDMRNLDSCLLDANCTVVDGACDYADHSPVGC